MPNQTLGDYSYIGRYYTDYGDNTQWSTPLLVGHKEKVWSSGHYGWQKPPPNRDVGGDFCVTYNTTERGTANVGIIQGGSAYAEHHYAGSVAAPLFQTLANSSVKTGQTWGAEAFSKMKPDQALMQGFVAAYELKDIPGMLKQRFTDTGLHEFTGNYYLALKFGWQALLQDVRNFVISHMKWQDKLNQLIRDEGKPVRRKIKLAASEVYDPIAYGTGHYQTPSFVTYFYADGGSYSYQDVHSDIVWASAQFRYWLPPGPRDVDWTKRMMGKIFGFNPTPHQVYNVIPWSWLFEWFAHIGNVLDNTQVNLVDRLAADYFYVMRQTEWTGRGTYTSRYFRDKSHEIVTATTPMIMRSGCKTRLRGDPFGFGINESSLTGSQIAILGALGLSRLR